MYHFYHFQALHRLIHPPLILALLVMVLCFDPQIAMERVTIRFAIMQMLHLHQVFLATSRDTGNRVSSLQHHQDQ